MIPRKLVMLGVLIILSIGGSFASDGWIVRQDGFGSAKIGMSLSQLNAALHEKFEKPQNKEDQGCFYVNPTKHPDVSLMIENGHLVRIDVDKAGVANCGGRPGGRS